MQAKEIKYYHLGAPRIKVLSEDSSAQKKNLRKMNLLLSLSLVILYCQERIRQVLGGGLKGLGRFCQSWASKSCVQGSFVIEEKSDIEPALSAMPVTSTSPTLIASPQVENSRVPKSSLVIPIHVEARQGRPRPYQKKTKVGQQHQLALDKLKKQAARVRQHFISPCHTAFEEEKLDYSQTSSPLESESPFMQFPSSKQGEKVKILNHHSCFHRVIPKTKITPNSISGMLLSMETHLLSRNVPVPIVQEITRRCQERLQGTAIPVWSNLMNRVKQIVQEELQSNVMTFSYEALLNHIREKKKVGGPFSIAITGVNGIGKTTTLAKIAYRLSHGEMGGLKVGIAACDTFRSGAIEQLRVHSKALNVPLFEQPYGRDSASVGYQAQTHFRGLLTDVVLMDTAGRMQNNSNLMKSLSKFIRVVKPDMVLFTGEATAGNDIIDQITQFQIAVIDGGRLQGIDVVCVTKIDVAEERIGTVVAVSYLTKKPLLFLGTGQNYNDLIPCDISTILNLLLSSEAAIRSAKERHKPKKTTSLGPKNM